MRGGEGDLLAVSRVPLTPPKVEQATKRDMTQATGPNSLERCLTQPLATHLLAKVTATASEPSTSGVERVVWKETMVST